MGRTSRSRHWLVPTLFTIAGVALLLGLGTWQVERLHWKEGLIARLEARLAEPPADLPEGVDPAAIEYRHVRFTGRFLHDKEMFLAGRTLDGEGGYHVVTPLQPPAGLPVLVDRGWIPLNAKDPASRPGSRPEGAVTVDGHIRLPAPPNLFTPDNQPDDNLWFSVDLAAMARHAGLAAVRPFYVQAGPGPGPKSLPRGIRLSAELPNNHLQYALTWYALAVALLVTYIVYMRRRRPG
jgi:surfeit locus 1 family protein